MFGTNRNQLAVARIGSISRFFDTNSDIRFKEIDISDIGNIQNLFAISNNELIIITDNGFLYHQHQENIEFNF